MGRGKGETGSLHTIFDPSVDLHSACETVCASPGELLELLQEFT